MSNTWSKRTVFEGNKRNCIQFGSYIILDILNALKLYSFVGKEWIQVSWDKVRLIRWVAFSTTHGSPGSSLVMAQWAGPLSCRKNELAKNCGLTLKLCFIAFPSSVHIIHCSLFFLQGIILCGSQPGCEEKVRILILALDITSTYFLGLLKFASHYAPLHALTFCFMTVLKHLTHHQ